MGWSFIYPGSYHFKTFLYFFPCFLRLRVGSGNQPGSPGCLEDLESVQGTGMRGLGSSFEADTFWGYFPWAETENQQV